MQIVPRINFLPEIYRPVTYFAGQSGAHLTPPPISRFLSKVNKLGPLWNGTHCWIWGGSSDLDGYGVFHPSKQAGAHRWSYEFHRGQVPKGLQLDHLCRRKNCVNPDHLEAVTCKENNARSNSPSALNARKTHCPMGHEYTPENTSRNPSGARLCRACSSIKYRAKQLAKKEKT